MIDDVLKYKRVDGVTDALRRIANAVSADAPQEASYRSGLAEVDGVTTLIWGELDLSSIPLRCSELRERVKIHLLANVGHMPHMEVSTTVNE